MDTLLWITQWILALFLVSSFLAAPAGIRMGLARRKFTAFLAACFGLACGLGLLVPGLTGHAKLVTPVAATLVLLTCLLDGLTNRMPPLDAFYLAVCVVLAVAIAIGRFHAFGQWHGSFASWAMVCGGTMLLVLCLLGNGESSRVRWGQAATGLVGILGGVLAMLGP